MGEGNRGEVPKYIKNNIYGGRFESGQDIEKYLWMGSF